MFNENFAQNWIKITTFNGKVENLKEARAIKNKIRIPLTPIDIEAYLLYYMFEFLYPTFINDQPNVLDIIVSDDGNDILNLYLYETKKAGIHESYQKLPTTIMKDKFFFQKVTLDKIDAFFNKLQLIIVDKKNIKISSVRIFKKSAIDIINKYCVEIEEISSRDFIRKIIELIQTIIEQDLFNIYPEPNILTFLKESIKFLKRISILDIFNIIDELLPVFDVAVVFFSKNQVFVLRLKKETNQSENPEYTIDITTPEELGVNLEEFNKQKITLAIKEQLNPSSIYYFNQDDVISLLLDAFELNVPIKKEQSQLIFQKILYGLRTYQKNWFKIPKAKNATIKRFFIKMLGLNLDVSKISHWAIPETLMNLFNSYFGLKSKILVIYTDVNPDGIRELTPNNYLEGAFKKGFLLEIENGSLLRIIPVEKDLIISENKINNVKVIRTRFSEMQGYISAVITIDRSLLQKVINDLMINFSKSKLRSKMKTLKMVKNQYYFNLYPELPFFKLLKKSGNFSLLKILSSIFIDKHEF